MTEIFTDDQLKVREYTQFVENKFAERFGFRGPVITRGGTESIIYSLIALGIKQSDEVILPVSICQSAVNAVILTGATPVLADVDENLALSRTDAVKRVNSKTKAIIFFHPFGLGCDLNRLTGFASNAGRKIFIIEDCAQAIGASVNGVDTGNQGDLSIFSFGMNKPLPVGIGGLVNVNDESLYERICYTCRSGAAGYSDYEVFGFNSTLSCADIQVLDRQLANFDMLLQQKLKKAKLYIRMLSDYGKFIGCNHFDAKKPVNIYHRVILEINTGNCKSLYQEITDYLQVKLSAQKIFTLQPTIPTPPYTVKFVNEYYRRIGRKDLISMDGEDYPTWKDKEYRYLYFRTNEFITEEAIAVTCDTMKEALRKYLNTG